MLEVRLLGSFDVRHNDKSIAISSRPAQALFAYLILNAGTAHRREKLAGLFWPDSLEETARDNLRHTLWRIRKALSSTVSTSMPIPAPVPSRARGGAAPAQAARRLRVSPNAEYLLADDLSIAFNDSADYWLDAAELEKLNEGASANELMTVLSLYQGELLPGFYDDWVVLEREHLYSIFEHSMARLLSLLEYEKRWLDILDWSERWIKLGQKPEPAYRALMSAHAAKGDMSKVVATYERCVRSLREFGIEPSEQTVKLYRQFKAGQGIPIESPLLERRQVQVRKEASARQSNLPVPLTSFIGREKAVEEVVRLLGKNRLVTLTGSGGVGKTRLAIESGNRLLPKFKDGVWWVDLVGLADPSLVPQEVAKVVDAREVPNQPMIETLVKHVAPKQLLLVLDNCEHVISACVPLADRLLGACKDLKILTTSREALDILGETTWTVPSLSLPELQESFTVKTLSKFESIRLFTERAVPVQPKFEITDHNAKSVVQICRRLSGIPLAIELAAARTKMMSVDEIAGHLDDSFGLLTAGSRTALPRHQTLRATIDWSYDLLSEPERILLRRLSVFVGGFTLGAAEVVTRGGDIAGSQIIGLLGNLINKSLVTVQERPEDTENETRYGMLETIRTYGHERLREAREEDSVRNRHLEFFVNMVEEVEPKLERSQQQIWLDRLETELDNLRTAIDWALASLQIIAALRVVAGLRRFWLIRNHDSEGIERVRALLGRRDAAQPTPARLKALNTYFFMLWAHGELTAVQSLIEEALALGVQLEDSWNTAFTFLWAGVSAAEQGDYPHAESYLQQSRAEWQDSGEVTPVAMSLVFLGEIAIFQDDFARAEGLFQAALQRFRESKDYPFLGMVLRRLGQLAMYRGDLLQATAFIREGLAYNWNIRDYRGSGACLAALAAVSAAQGQAERAAKLFGIVEALVEFTHIPLLPFDQQQYEQNLRQLREGVDQKILARSWAKGKAMTVEQAITLVLDEA